MIEVVREPKRLTFTVFIWGEVLKFARLYGWTPAGTLPPEEADADERAAWDGNYVTNSGQGVRPSDAWALGEALARGLSDLPEHDAATHKTLQGEEGTVPRGRWVPVGMPISPIEALSGPNRAAVRELIAFCRDGGFELW
jgi:hypothetical protein